MQTLNILQAGLLACCFVCKPVAACSPCDEGCKGEVLRSLHLSTGLSQIGLLWCLAGKDSIDSSCVDCSVSGLGCIFSLSRFFGGLPISSYFNTLSKYNMLLPVKSYLARTCKNYQRNAIEAYANNRENPCSRIILIPC